MPCLTDTQTDDNTHSLEYHAMYMCSVKRMDSWNLKGMQTQHNRVNIRTSTAIQSFEDPTSDTSCFWFGPWTIRRFHVMFRSPPTPLIG